MSYIAMHMPSPSPTLSKHHTMVSPVSSTDKSKARILPPPMGLYYSPPEETPLDSFSKSPTWHAKLAPMRSPSPPRSPNATPALPSIASVASNVPESSTGQDPPLYSKDASHGEQGADSPLFHSEEPESPEQGGNACSPDFTSRRPHGTPQPVEPKVDAWPAFRNLREPGGYLKYWQSCCNELAQMRAPNKKPKPTTLDSGLRASKDTLSKVSNGAITKSRSPPKPKTSKPASAAAKTTKTSLREKVAITKSPSMEPDKRKRAPPSKETIPKQEDLKWASLPDHCPPTSTLEPRPKGLRVHWKNHPLDISSDPDIQSMHPQEVEAAAELRLTGAQYLANKRRIFTARLDSIREHKNFTKTAAQQACNIDVNKTSRLWEAFEKVGWFREEHFHRWL